MCKTFFIIGTTCVGKDYLIETACTKYPHLFGAVQVGKELRRRHPPEYFQGLGCAPACYDEALDIYREQWKLNQMIGKKYILVSGQPREMSQVQPVLDFAKGTVVWMFAPHDVIMERLEKRFANDTSSKELALQRLKNDRVQLYDTIFELLTNGHTIKTLDTRYRPTHEVVDQIAHFGDF